MTYPAVYALLRERMADENDIPTDDEIIAAALDVARDAVAALPCPITFCGMETFDHARSHLLAVIDALRVSE